MTGRERRVRDADRRGCGGSGGRANRLASRRSSVLAGLLVLVSLALVTTGSAQLTPSEVELEDVIEVEVNGRNLIGYDLLGTATPTVELELKEEVTWMRAAGRVGLALTGDRVLAVSPNTDGWREIPFGIHETPPSAGYLGKRVALVVTDRRVLGYDSLSATWSALSLGPNEAAEHAEVGDSTAVVVTNRNAYGLSPGGGFYARALAIHERVETLRVRANMATLSTSQRLLVFRAPTGIWTEERRPLH